MDGQSNWQGSVVLSSNTQLAAVVSEYSGYAPTLGQGFRADAYPGASSIAASTNISIPQLLRNVPDSGTNGFYNSTIAIQNTSATAPANVTLTYKNYNGNLYSRSVSIPANSSHITQLDTDSALSPLGTTLFYGTGTVTSSDQPVTVVVSTNSIGFLSTFAGFTSSDAATTLYAPQLLKYVYDGDTDYTWSTSILAMVADGSTGDVTVTYYPQGGSPVSSTQKGVSMATFDQRFAVEIPGGFYGSAVISANKPVIAFVYYLVDYTASRGVEGSAYRAFTTSGAGTTVYIPLLRKNDYDPLAGVTWSTSVLGRLLGSGSTTITITYYHSNGNTYTQTWYQTLTPTNPMFTLDQRFSAIPNGSMSAVIRSNPPQPFAANVLVIPPKTVLGDGLMSFPGVPGP